MENPGVCEYLNEWQPAVWVLDKYQVHKIFVFPTESPFKYDAPFYNLPHNCLLVASKRSFAVAQLIQQYAKTPHV